MKKINEPPLFEKEISGLEERNFWSRMHGISEGELWP
jgi:hypothetical protein